MIHIFLRQTSHNDNRKRRPKWFDYEKCFVNLLETIDFEKCKLTIMFDGIISGHFTEKYKDKYKFEIVQLNSNSEHQSFFDTCNYIYSQDHINDNDIIYLVENDYLHRENWVEIILDLFTTYDIEHYVTVYDHNDKYFLPDYDDLKSKIFTTKKSHWRTTPSTTGTFFIKNKIFREDHNILSTVVGDHNKFTNELANKGRYVLSSIPGYSTHCEVGLMSPTINWEKING